MFLNTKSILEILKKDFKEYDYCPEKVFFYGAGCAAKQAVKSLNNALKTFFKPNNINIESDMLGAARSLWQNEKGYAAILGTGTNCCFYNGNTCKQIKTSLGYIFGDEGSGAYLGKEFVKLFLKNQLPENLNKKFEEQYKISKEHILYNVYNNKFPNRYLASFVPFLHQNLNNTFIYNIIEQAFKAFFEEYFKDFENNKYSLRLTGSVAFYFKNIIETISAKYEVNISLISKDPLEDLVLYHKMYV